MAKIKVYSTPSRLYRYRTLGKNLKQELSSIEGAYIYCPSFLAMNDPMEGKHRESSAFILRRTSATETRKIEIEKNKLGIASLSETYNHEPMWAHYADSFQGMCVAYSTSRLLANLTDDIDLVRMFYNEHPPTLLADRNAPIDKAKVTLSAKTVRWSTEREWRLIAPSIGKARYSKMECVLRIYLGSRISQDDEDAVRASASSLKIRVSKMKIDEYSIQFSATGR